jgi:hypothetical protein
VPSVILKVAVVDVKLRRVSRSGNVYDVTFHREHLRLSVSILSRYTGSTRWKMKVFKDVEVAKRHLFWEEGKFGFWCEDEYYFVFLTKTRSGRISPRGF